MEFSWFEVLVMVGITQGLVTSALLFKEKDNRTSKQLLSFALIAFSLVAIKMVFNTLGLAKTYDSLRFIPLATELAIAPLIYFYSLSLIQANFTFSKKHYLHFIPFLCFFVFGLVVFIAANQMNELAQMQDFAHQLFYAQVKSVEDYLTLISIFVYMSLGYLKLRAYRRFVTENISDASCPTFTWLLQIFVMLFMLYLFLMVNMLFARLFGATDATSLLWKAYFVYMACVIYYLGFKGYKNPVFSNVSSKVVEDITPSLKIPKNKIVEIVKRFDELMGQQKLFLDPTITALQVAQLLDVSQSNLSFSINQHYGKGFRDVINQFRINEITHKLIKYKDSKVSVLATALECGFNSEASFYRVFKKQTGMSPKQFLADITK